LPAEARPPAEEPRDLSHVTRFYNLAKKQEWQIDELSWDALPPVPEPKAGASDRRKDIHSKVWQSVIGQQLQADQLAVKMANQLLDSAPEPEAKQYYETLVADEERHTEVWEKLIAVYGGLAERDPYLDELVRMVLEADTIEEKVFLMQVFFEAAIIPRFKQIQDMAGATVLAELCTKLKVDDGIHHGSGVAYMGVLMQYAGEPVKQKVVHTAELALPVFVNHALWRPKPRRFIGLAMETTDKKMILQEVERGKRTAHQLGMDMSHINVEFPAN
jgi:hypothetical protein